MTPPQSLIRRALVVDDDFLVAALVRDVLEAGAFEVRVAHHAKEAIEAFAHFDPDVAILDVELGKGPSGIDVAHIAHRAYPTTALLLLTRYPDLQTAQLTDADLPDGCAFLTKQQVTDSGVLLNTVEVVLRGLGERPRGPQRGEGPLAGLTRTQLAVLRLVVQGFTNAEIARRRGCTTNAVEKMLTSIYDKLDIDTGAAVHPRAEAIRIWASSAALPERIT